MSRYLSEEFKAIQADVEQEYGPASRWVYARQWWRRVGKARVVAADASWLADRLLHDIHAAVFQNDPRMFGLLLAARDATRELSTELAQDNYRRFQGRPESQGSETGSDR